MCLNFTLKAKLINFNYGYSAFLSQEYSPIHIGTTLKETLLAIFCFYAACVINCPWLQTWAVGHFPLSSLWLQFCGHILAPKKGCGKDIRTTHNWRLLLSVVGVRLLTQQQQWQQQQLSRSSIVKLNNSQEDDIKIHLERRVACGADKAIKANEKMKGICKSF